MASVLRKLLGALWMGVAILVILAAVLTVVARQILPQVPGYRARIEQVAGDYLHHPVRIGHILVGWHWIYPYVRLENVQVLDAAGKAALSLNRVGLQLGLWNSILAEQLVPGWIRLSGVRLRVTRHRDGHLDIGGFRIPPAGQGLSARSGIPVWLTRVTYQLQKASLRVDDQVDGRHYRFSDISLMARPVDDGLELGGTVLPSGHMGHRVDFAARLYQGDGQGGWRARVYLDLEAIRLDAFPTGSWLPGLKGLKGALSAQLWSQWSGGQLRQVTGHLTVNHLALTGHPGNMLTGLSANLRWQRLSDGWRLQGNRFQVTAGQTHWPVDAFAFSQSHPGGQRHLAGWLSFLRLQDVSPVLIHLPGMPEDWSARLKQLSPAGDLENIRFALDASGKKISGLTASGTMRDLSVQASGHEPGVSGLNGRLVMNQKGGYLAVNSAALVVTAPDVFGAPLPAVAAQGRVNWHQDPGGTEVLAPQFTLSNPDLALKGQLGLWLPVSGTPQISLLLGIQHGNAVAAARYLPVRHLPADLVRWLEQSIRGGTVTSGSVILRGDPRHFPFRQHRGVFDAAFEVRNGQLDYFRHWPGLKDTNGSFGFYDHSLWARVTRARLLNTSVSDVDVSVPDLGHAVIGIQGQGQGPLADIAQYLSFTPVGDGRKALFDEIRSSGQTRFTLRLSLPLEKAKRHLWSLSGQGRVQDGRFALPKQDFALQGINGELHFTQRSLEAKGIRAMFRGVPVILAASTHRPGLATLTLDGHLTVAKLLGAQSMVAHYAQGATDWRAALTLPMTTPAYRRYGVGLTLVSGLKGVRVSLPDPVGKSAKQSRGLVVERSLDHVHAPVFVRYGPDLRSAFELAGSGQCLRVTRGDLSLGAGVPVLPASGVNVQGHLARFDADVWRRLLSSLPASSSAHRCPGGRGLSGDLVRKLDVRFGELDLFGRRLAGVQIRATRQKQLWSADIASNVITGRLLIPVPLHGGKPLRFDLSNLNLDGKTTPASARGKPVNPASLPPLSGHIGTLEVAGRQLHNVQLVTTPTRQGLQIHLAQVDEPHFRASASGSWQQGKDGKSLTRIQLTMDSDDAGKALDALNVQAGLAGGKGHLSAMLHWSGGPQQISWAVLEGHASLDLKNGRLMQVNPGQAGRLLGLLNLAALPQRLTLNFGDVFDKGFVFNDLNSHFELRKGNIYTQDTHIRGASANMSITGRVGMVARDYDAQVNIVPQVQSTLAIAGAVIGGPVTGAALFLLDRVLGIGNQIDKAAAFRYHVSGPWNAPNIQSEDDRSKPPPPSPKKQPPAWESLF